MHLQTVHDGEKRDKETEALTLITFPPLSFLIIVYSIMVSSHEHEERTICDCKFLRFWNTKRQAMTLENISNYLTQLLRNFWMNTRGDFRMTFDIAITNLDSKRYK